MSPWSDGTLQREPWRFDLFALLRRLEREQADLPRIGDSASRHQDIATLGQDPFLEFPASTINGASTDQSGRVRLSVRFLGLLGPQGALPLSTTEEAYQWFLAEDDSFPRFLDIFNNRFLQLFFRAWADSRPIAQYDRPDADRFHAYIGSLVGIGSPSFANLDSVSDLDKLAYAGLLAPRTRSASRLRSFIAGVFGVEVEIDEFVPLPLSLETSDQSSVGTKNSSLGKDIVIGASVLSFQDKFRIRIYTSGLEEYEEFLPGGRRARELADAIYFYLGDELDWDIELALPSGAAPPVKLGQSARLGWVGWVSPGWVDAEERYRCDARFHPPSRRGNGPHAANPEAD